MPDLTASSAVLDAPGSRLAVGAPPSSESPGFRRAARAPGEPVEPAGPVGPAGAAGDARATGSTGAGRTSGPAGQLVRTVDGAPLTPDVRVLVVTVATGRAAPAAPISPASLAGSADAAARASWGSRATPLRLPKTHAIGFARIMTPLSVTPSAFPALRQPSKTDAKRMSWTFNQMFYS